jgi:hypothetical protein
MLQTIGDQLSCPVKLQAKCQITFYDGVAIKSHRSLVKANEPIDGP